MKIASFVLFAALCAYPALAQDRSCDVTSHDGSVVLIGTLDELKTFQPAGSAFFVAKDRLATTSNVTHAISLGFGQVPLVIRYLPLDENRKRYVRVVRGHIDGQFDEGGSYQVRTIKLDREIDTAVPARMFRRDEPAPGQKIAAIVSRGLTVFAAAGEIVPYARSAAERPDKILIQLKSREGRTPNIYSGGAPIFDCNQSVIGLIGGVAGSYDGNDEDRRLSVSYAIGVRELAHSLRR